MVPQAIPADGLERDDRGLRRPDGNGEEAFVPRVTSWNGDQTCDRRNGSPLMKMENGDALCNLFFRPALRKTLVEPEGTFSGWVAEGALLCQACWPLPLGNLANSLGQRVANCLRARSWGLQSCLPRVSTWQTHLAPSEAWERRKRCNEYITATFRWNPVGNQSHPVEPGRQPEASVAWRPAMAAAKGRQPVPKPCHGAPRLPHPRVALCLPLSA
jgi:hypothetical protein